ncbi:heterogeneous nuclear ribonucleoprotein A2 homolog 2 [Chanos chanos]|uniref:Heterogeneous nuclear ribonucleoprotein A2 homolog 2 n=1 Tax=Chanos chanos TaxID=29144 RepID=A0A6J2WJ34_CHACN|nr:heterogeneous nuclear ribonucleoprotein A2 homolog 2-like [Chanos chanos]
MESKKRLFDHGIVVKGLHPYLTKSDLQSYFQQWGEILECEIKRILASEHPVGLGYVRYSSQEEAEAAEEAGPHVVAGLHTEVRRVMTPKVDEYQNVSTRFQNPKTGQSLAYRLAYSAWLAEA